MDETYLYSAELTSFGDPTPGKFIVQGDTTVFKLEGDTGGGVWATIPDSEISVLPFEGMIFQEPFDGAGNGVDWSIYSSFRCSYTVDDNGTQTTYTNEAVTFGTEETAVQAAGHNARAVSRIGNDLYIRGVVYAGGFVVAGSVMVSETLGPKAPGTAADDVTVGTIAWTNVNNAKDDDADYASVQLASGEISHYLKLTSFAGTVPSTAAVTGIKFRAKVLGGGGIPYSFYENSVKMIRDGLISGNELADINHDWGRGSLDPVWVEWGGVNERAGLTWTPAQASASGWVCSVTGTVTHGNLNGYVYYVERYVYYTIATNIVRLDSQTVRLSSTFSTTSTTAVDVTGMSFPIGAGENWAFEFNLVLGATTTNGQKFAITVPAGATLEAVGLGTTGGAAAQSEDRWTASGTLGAVAFCAVATDGHILRIAGVVANGATPGTVQLRMAKVTAGTAKVLANSTVIAQKVAKTV